jgi:aryl-alcohol dehydrogenase-like predicted oxidoreductase
MIPLCLDQGIGLIPWSPLARGKLAHPRDAGTVRSRTDPFAKTLYDATAAADEKVLSRVEEIASARGVPPAQIALAWLFHKPGVTAPIVGASKPQHLQDALAAASLKLNADEIKKLEEPYVPHPVAGHE